MQLGFVIDHTRCIGCHACTVACKSENDVPLGKFRTWVKYTERGAFPEVRRSFAVLRCNQCSAAPCVTICPVGALSKRPDGIVDVDPARCIGCKACMQGCPYDALYVNDTTGTAEKCHFCAHRTEVGLAPACAVVCPTEAIIPGDFDDPASAVSRLRAENDLRARKPEAGTGPNVLYREVSEDGVDPSRTHAAGGYLWSHPMPGLDLEAERYAALLGDAEARTTYDVDHAPLWGSKVSAYLFTKSLASGLFLLLFLLMAAGSDPGSRTLAFCLGGALFFLGVTSALLVVDLKRPERFLYILVHPNWSSWLARGAFLLAGYGALLTLFSLLMLLAPPSAGTRTALLAVTALFAFLTAAYTGWLFGQAKGRVLWMRRGLAAHLGVQAFLAGAAAVLLCLPALDISGALVRWTAFAALVLHATFHLAEEPASPKGREREYRRTIGLMRGSGPLARRKKTTHALTAFAALLLLAPWPGLWSAAGALALLALYLDEDLLVRAGQKLPIS